MTRTGSRKGLVILTVTLMLSFLLPLGYATTASAATPHPSKKERIRIEREELLLALGQQSVCASGGSSCASGALQASHVLAAMGVPETLARGAIRFSLGQCSTDAEIDRALALVPDVVASLRRGV